MIGFYPFAGFYASPGRSSLSRDAVDLLITSDRNAYRYPALVSVAPHPFKETDMKRKVKTYLKALPGSAFLFL